MASESQVLCAPSPNGAYVLIGDMPSSQLLLEDARTHARRSIFGVTVQTMSVVWAPDSSAFVANDRAASTWEDGYLYDVQTLARQDLRKIILQADPRAARIVSNPNTTHAYVHAVRWIDSSHLEAVLNGRTDSHGTPRHIVRGRCFDFRYRVAADGKATATSKRTSPAGDCQDMDNYMYGEKTLK